MSPVKYFWASFVLLIYYSIYYANYLYLLIAIVSSKLSNMPVSYLNDPIILDCSYRLLTLILNILFSSISYITISTRSSFSNFTKSSLMDNFPSAFLSFSFSLSLLLNENSDDYYDILLICLLSSYAILDLLSCLTNCAVM